MIQPQEHRGQRSVRCAQVMPSHQRLVARWDGHHCLAETPCALSTHQSPEESSQFRATVAGRLRVYRSRDAGRRWTALANGLPQQNVFVTILRDGLDSDGLEPLGLYLGTSSGHLFASTDGGDRWRLLAGFLPGILSVRATDMAAVQP